MFFAADDGGFSPFRQGSARRKTWLVGVEVGEDYRILDVVLSKIWVDGLDATDALIAVVRRLRLPPRLVMLPSLCLAGFNVVDAARVSESLDLPLVAVNRQRPRPQAVRAALKKHFGDWQTRYRLLRRAGPSWALQLPGNGKIFLHVVGLDPERAAAEVRRLTVFGGIPEPLRIARLMARGLPVRSG